MKIRYINEEDIAALKGNIRIYGAGDVGTDIGDMVGRVRSDYTYCLDRKYCSDKAITDRWGGA